MNAIEVLKAVGRMGCRYKSSDLTHIIEYVTKMIEDKRVVMICEDGVEHSVLFFSLTDSEHLFLRKGTWDYLAHDPYGRYVYVEKLVSKKWSKTLRMLFEKEIIKIYPQITHGVWHRWATYGDRKVISKRRISNV